jgi:hypothetical protein
MLRIKTPKDWWELVDAEWVNLSTLIERFTPTPYEKTIDELVREIKGKTSLVRAIEMKENRDWEGLHSIFQNTWGYAPDVPGLDSIPGWLDLCDLCSEIWVFDDRR